MTFTGRLITTYAADPIQLTEDQLTPGMKADPWLEISEVNEEDAKQDSATPILQRGIAGDEGKTPRQR